MDNNNDISWGTPRFVSQKPAEFKDSTDTDACRHLIAPMTAYAHTALNLISIEGALATQDMRDEDANGDAIRALIGATQIAALITKGISAALAEPVLAEKYIQVLNDHWTQYHQLAEPVLSTEAGADIIRIMRQALRDAEADTGL